MKKLLLSAFVLCFAGTIAAQEVPLWMRYCALSPDGTTIAFTYKGDIYTVPSTGGRATQITTNPAFDTTPVWSPDGKQIAFASDRMGSLDVFVVAKEGGVPQRLTTHSGSEKPVAYKDDKHILFTANIAPSAEDAGFPSGQFQQIYEVAVTGGRPTMFSSMPMECISINKEGIMLYQDKKGYEDYWRKHQVSPIARDIWSYTPGKTPVYQKQTTFGGEDREPVWAPDGKSFYYLSEEKGSFNIFQRTPGANTSKQITFHTKHPVRFLSMASEGKLCYGYNGEIYTLVPGGQPQKVNITILSDKIDKDIIRQIRSYGATDIAVSPKGKEVAFIMRGDVYVTSIDYKTTKQITNTPDQERDISFAPDGRTLVYSSERNGLWQLYTSTIVRKEEKQFTYATELKEERLTKSNVASFQPQYSPDGKEIAFLENRTAIRVINLKSKAVRTVMDAKYQYSYADGDQWFQWSPDSKWILSDFIGIGGWNNKDVVLLKADGKGEMVNLTESGYSDTNAKWVLGGKAMIWNSDRSGYRSHGSWGSESDTYIMFFDAEAYDRFLMSKEETALVEEAEKAEKEAKEKAEKKKETKKKTDKDRIKEWQSQIDEINEAIADNKEKAKDAIFGEDLKSAIDNFANAQAEAWASGEDRAESAKDTVKKMMRQMVTESIKAATESSGAMEKIRDKLKEFYADNVLSGWEQDYIYNMAEELQKEIDRQFGWADSLMKDKVEEPEKEEDISENSLKGAYAKASQESIDLLAGQTGAVRILLEDIRGGMQPIREQMRLIYDMQSRGWEDVKAIRELSDKVEKNTDRIAENTREIKEVAGKISENTRGTVDALEGTINVKVKM